MLFLVHLIMITSLITFIRASNENFIIELNDAHFEEKILDYEHILVLFYSPECIHCTNFIPEYEKAADDLRRNEPPVYLAMVNCLKEGKEVCKQEELKELPTLKVYTRGIQTDEYEGERNSENVVDFMKRTAGIISTELNLKDIDEYLRGLQEICVLAYLKPNGTLREQYFGLPPELGKNLKFAHYNLKEADEIASEVILQRPKYLQNKFEEDFVRYQGRGYDLEIWIRSHKHGIAGLRTPLNVQEFESPLILAYFPIDVAKKPKMFSYWRNRILKVAQNYTVNFKFAVCSKDEFSMEFRKFGIDENSSEKPIVFAILKDNTKYLMEDEFSSEIFEEFVLGVLKHTLEPHMKSQPVPETVEGPIKVAVAKNFKKVVFENNWDTLLVFFAPWCNHCRQLEEPLQEAAQKLIDEEVAVVKMDATANEIPAGFDLHGYPTMYWLPKNMKESPRIYSGGRTTEGIIKFIAEHATEELKRFDRHGKDKSFHEEL